MIAARSGVPWRTIWGAPENKALRESGRQPNVLLPNDELHVPERALGTVSLATDRRHRVLVQGMLTTIYIRITAHLEPLPNEPWAIELPDGALEGTTNGDGILEARIPVRLARADLLLPKRRQRYTLRLGALDPVETFSGARARLRNLGLTSTERIDDDELKPLLRIFQRARGLDESTELDQPTTNALREDHGV